MARITCEYDFEELRLSGEGLMAAGTATLVSSDPDYGGDDEFVVLSIKLTGGEVLLERGSGVLGFPHPFKEALFGLIAEQICNPKTAAGRHAAIEWADAVAEARQPDPDRAHDERRERQMEMAR